MNVKNGAYSVPPEIHALAPRGIPCRIEIQYYQPKKEGKPSGPVRIYYYVYEDRSADNRPAGMSSHSRRLLGKIMGNQFIPNKYGISLLNQRGSSSQDDSAETTAAQKEQSATEPTPEKCAADASSLPEGLKKYYPRLRDVDLENKDYGEYTIVLASTSDVLEGLQQYFHPEDAIRMYALSIIYFIEEYTPASYCGDLFRQSILSDKWTTLSFGEDTINSFLKEIGQHGLMCEKYSQSLIDSSSELTALDGHVIMSNSRHNELAEYGYKYRELKDKQINVMGAYDAVNKRQLISKAMRGSLPDKLSVQELFVAYRFSHKTFLADSGFYSEDNLGYFRKNDNHFIIPVPGTCVIAKMMKENLSFTDSFVYEHVNEDGTKTPRIILYKESTVAALEAMDDQRKDAEAHQKNEREKAQCKDGEKPKKYYPQYNKKSQWGEDRVIIYRDVVMHDKLVYDYRSQIGIDPRHTEEEFQRLEPFFGVIVLRVDQPKDKLSAKAAYLSYKKRWTIETHYNFVANIVKFDGLQTENYYAMQGLSFLILLVGQIKKSYMDKLRSSPVKYVKNLSLQESIVKAGFVKMAKHMDNRWHVTVLNDKSVELLNEMGVNIEEDMKNLNNGTF